MALLAVKIPEHDRVVAVGVVGHTELGRAALELFGMFESRRPGHGDPGKVALHIGEEHRNPGRREAFGQPLQRHRLACAGRARDEPVAIRPAEPQVLRFAIRRLAEENLAHCPPLQWL